MSNKVEESLPWTNKIHSTPWYSCYRDGDRFLFVPKDKNAIGMTTAFDSAYKLANSSPIEGAIGYQITLKIGEISNREISQPYLELSAIKSEPSVVEIVREAI